MKKQQDDKAPVPKLPQEVKKLNGKSGKRLIEHIDMLTHLLDEDGCAPDRTEQNRDKIIPN